MFLKKFSILKNYIMGQDLSTPQKVTVTGNGKWVHAHQANAYVRIDAIAYFRVDGNIIIFRLKDNDSESGNTNNYFTRSINTVTTERMSDAELQDLIDVLTEN